MRLAHNKVILAISTPVALAPTAFAQTSVPQRADDWQVYLRGDSLTWSESFSIEAMLSGLRGGFAQGGEFSITHNHIELGASKGTPIGDVEVGVFYRYDYLARYSPSASIVGLNIANGIPFGVGDYDLTLGVQHSQARGLRLGYKLEPLDSLDLTVGLSGFAAVDLLYGSTSGTGNISNAGELSAALDIDYSYSSDLVFDREVDKPSGIGAALDFGAEWRPHKRISFELDVRDLWSETVWDEAPRTVASLQSTRVTETPDGRLEVSPFFSGRHSYEELKLSYPIKSNVKASYQVSDKWRVHQDAFLVESHWLSETGVTRKFGPDIEIGAKLEWTQNAVGISAAWKGVQLEVATNSLDLDRASYLECRLVGRFSFG